MKWYLIANDHYNENAGAYGYGDYPTQIHYLAAIVEAGTERKAQNQAKRIHTGLTFSKGSQGPYLVSDTEWEDVSKTYNLKADADKRLSPPQQSLHNSCVKALCVAQS